ncbi:(2R)-3-sulfolactate dehydrogenase (NADP(+))-like [Vanessa cardui]|uniref:(2R)-3-sulfolactate dehydrogenase (NADP(+))-like n=1 Tax=Vanessa cardui TaxID=171605 RepID=UPI001F1327EA|nr:(2R)-3-sulfolactate dehydrogenase (NADP(+))-like [Vanessa cardui]
MIMPEVEVREVERFMVESLVAAGAPLTEAKAHADLLLHADTVGHFSHGLNRLELYINDLKSGVCNGDAKPVILKETIATAWVDGCDGLGATVGNFCMDLAIKKARECGVGWVAVKRCHHYGMAGYWALKAEKEGLIGMSFTNSAAIMVPTRAKKSANGTNPIAMAAPAAGGDSIVVDMATTTAAMGKVEVQIRKGEPIPEGWALGPDGKTTTDPQVAFDTGRLLPLGGFEKTSGYKGFGLSAMVEVFCSGLSGSRATHNVPQWTYNQTEAPNLGQCFVAVDPGCFAPGFEERIADCLQHWRNMEPVDPSLPVLAPGDKEKNNAKATTARGTITYPQGQLDSYKRMAERIGVRPLEVYVQ